MNLKVIGAVLMVVAGIVAGTFIGAYYSEPIMAGVVNSQSATISEQSNIITKLNLANNNQKTIILDQDVEMDSLNVTINDINVCYKAFKGNATPTTIDRFYTCMGRII